MTTKTVSKSSASTMPTFSKIRSSGVASRNQFSLALSKAGIKSSDSFSRCTNALYRALFEMTSSELRRDMKLSANESIRDHLSKDDLAMLNLAEDLIGRILNATGIHGVKRVQQLCTSVGFMVEDLVSFGGNTANFDKILIPSKK